MKIMKIMIKALSVNSAWKGQRFKTKAYKDYEQELLLLLPKYNIPEGKLKAYYIFGLSSKNADGDNCIKQFQDIVAKKYGFNDKVIYKWDIEKVDVLKGEEFIEFKFESYEANTTKNKKTNKIQRVNFRW